MPRALAVLRCLRISLAPSAFADVVAGALVGVSTGGEITSGRLGLAALASLAIYHAGMAFNDYADREQDAVERPERPLPSGDLTPGLVLGLGLALVGVALAAAALGGRDLLLVVAILAALVFGYDFAAKRSALGGPLLLGACRALNLGLGVVASAGGAALDAVPVFAALGYGLYVALVSGLARLEVGTVPSVRAGRLARATAFAFLLPVFPLRSWIAAAVVASIATSWLWREREPVWEAGRVRATVGRRLAATILLDAALALAAGFPLAAAGLGALYALARTLARRFPPT